MKNYHAIKINTFDNQEHLVVFGTKSALDHFKENLSKGGLIRIGSDHTLHTNHINYSTTYRNITISKDDLFKDAGGNNLPGAPYHIQKIFSNLSVNGKPISDISISENAIVTPIAVADIFAGLHRELPSNIADVES